MKGIKHLIVLPSPALTGVPIEALTAAQPTDGPRPTIRYAPSGTMFARLTAPRSQPSVPPRLLALGDPAFPRPAPSGPPPSPPDHGLAILAVEPNGLADLFGIKAGDMLQEYNGKVLKTRNDLAVVPAGDKAARVPVKLWRDGVVEKEEVLMRTSKPNELAAKITNYEKGLYEEDEYDDDEDEDEDDDDRDDEDDDDDDDNDRGRKRRR